MRPAFEPAAGLGRAHPHETTPRSIDADVAIIGAGPVGLMIANILGLQGVRVVVVEKLTQIIDYPRAIGLDDEALRVFQSVGLAEALLPHTTPNHWMRFTLNGSASRRSSRAPTSSAGRAATPSSSRSPIRSCTAVSSVSTMCRRCSATTSTASRRMRAA
jgi:hypothetical protein